MPDAHVDHPDSGRQAYSTADSLTLAVMNVGASIALRLVGSRYPRLEELAVVGSAAFLAPSLALLAFVFAFRDVRRGKDSHVVFAVILTLVALWASWWPLLEAD